MSKPQSYQNHIRFYPPHHFVFYPLVLVLMAACAWFAFDDEANTLLWIFMGITLAVITFVAFMLRQHYALTLQNRLVLLELRYRYFTVTGTKLEPFEDKLTEGQLFALRFAPDEELEALAKQAVAENLSPNKIKRSVKNWRADNRRV